PPLLVEEAPLVATTPVSPAGKELLPDKEPSKTVDGLDAIESGSARANAGGGTEVDYEAIVAAEPDLIIPGFPVAAEDGLDEERSRRLRRRCGSVRRSPRSGVRWGRRPPTPQGLRTTSAR